MKYNYYFTPFIFVFVFVLLSLFIGFRFASGLKEGFTWSDDLKKRFVEFQQTENDNRNQYNMEVIQQQASPKEVEELLATGFWPWSDDTRYQYMDSVWHNKIIKVNIGDAMEYAQKTYNEAAAKRLLAWNPKANPSPQFRYEKKKIGNFGKVKRLHHWDCICNSG